MAIIYGGGINTAGGGTGGAFQDATTSVKGIVRLGTVNENVNGTSESIAATPKGVRQVIDNLVADAPDILDTLQEIADAIGNDPDFIGRVVALETALPLVQAELDTAETGAGLNATGAYIQPVGTNFLQQSTSLHQATVLLDTQSKLNADAIVAEQQARIADVNAEEARAIGAEQLLSSRLDQEILDRAAAVSAEAVRAIGVELDLQAQITAINQVDSGLQNEVDAIEAGVGLSTAGNFTAPLNTNFLGASTTVKQMSVILDGQIKTTNDNVSDLANDVLTLSGGLAQEILDRTNADSLLQAAIDAEVLARQGSDNTLQGNINTLNAEVNAIETSVGLQADGTKTNFSSTVVVTANSTFKAAIEALDAGIGNLQQGVSQRALQDEVDAIEASLGAFVSIEGAFVPTVGSHFLDTATSLSDATLKLDTAIHNVSGAVTSEVTARQDADTGLQNQIDAINAGNTQASLLSEINQIETSVGLNESGTYTAPEGSQFLGASTSIKSALVALDQNLATVFNDFDLHHLHTNSFFVNGDSDIQTVHDLQSFGQGSVMYVASGSYGGATLTLSKQNFLIQCASAPTGSAITELSGGRGITVEGVTCTRVRIVNLQVEGAFLIDGTEGRHYFQNVDFGSTVTLTDVPNFVVFQNCSFAAGISITGSATVYFNDCQMNGQTVSGRANPFLTIMSDCDGVPVTQANLTSGVALAGRIGYADSTVTFHGTKSNFISALGVQTSFTGSYNELRDKPTIPTASTQLSDSANLLRTANLGNTVAPITDGKIPSQYLPSLVLTQVHTVADAVELANLPNVHTLNEGDVAIQLDTSEAWIWDGTQFLALSNGIAPVTSVNQFTGDVVLETNHISESAVPTNKWFTDARALAAAVTSSIDTDNKAPSTQTVKSYLAAQLASYVLASDYDDLDVLAKIKNVDGTGSGLDADLLDGINSDAFVQTSGAQSIAGVKTFSSSPIVPTANALDKGTKAASTAYVDRAVQTVVDLQGANGQVILIGDYDPTTNTPATITSSKKGYLYNIVADGAVAGVDFLVGDQILFVEDVAGGAIVDTNFAKIDNTEGSLTAGGLAIVDLANAVNTTLVAGNYYIYAGAGNASLSLPPAKNTSKGQVIYLRHYGTGTLTIVGNTFSGSPNSTGSYGTKIQYSNTQGWINGVRNIVITAAGEYKFLCISRTTVVVAAPLGVPQYDYGALFDTTVTNKAAIRTTDDLAEGVTNKYASSTTVRSYLSQGTGITYNSTTGVITNAAPYSDASVRAAVSGGTGLSYTQATGVFALNANLDALTDVVTSGANAPANGQALIYNGTNWVPTSIPAGYSDEQAQDAVNAMLTAGEPHTGISYTYTDNGAGAGALTSTVSLAGFSTTNLAEGTNLYYTQERVEDAVNTLLTAGAPHTGISYTYTDNGAGAGALTSTVSLSSFAISDLGNVTAGAPQDDQALMWDNATSQWTAQDIPASTAMDVLALNSNGGVQDLQKSKFYVYAIAPLANATLRVPTHDNSTLGTSIFIKIRNADNVFLFGSSSDASSVVYINNQAVGAASSTKLKATGEYKLTCTAKAGGVAVYELSASTAVGLSDTDNLAEGVTNKYYSDSLVSDYLDTVKGQANGIASLDGDGKLPVAQLPASVTTVYADKQLYYSGELMPLQNSQYWKVLQDVWLLEAHFELQNTPTGAGSTTVKLIKNNDLNNVLYSGIFTAGDLLKTSTLNVQLSQYDKVSLVIDSVTDGFHGADLVVSIQYSKSNE